MRLPVRSSLFSAVLIAGLLASVLPARGQVQPSVQSSGSQTSGNGTYIVVDPLANVRYDNRWDVSLGLAYDHIKAGPNLLQGSNLGGLDLDGSYWFSRHWGLEGSGRAYLGTSGAAPNTFIDSQGNTESIQGPFVAQYLFVAGPEWLGPHNKHGALIAHAMFGGAYGKFEQDLRGQSPSLVGFYNDQVAPAAIIGGHMDLNRSERWVFRITPDAVITRYGINYASKLTQTDVNFAISVGVEYRFKSKRR
jgi:hypothetical protein